MALVFSFALNGTLERLPRLEKGEHLVNLQTSFFYKYLVLVPGSWCWCVTPVTHFIHLQLSSISFHKWHNCPRIDLCLFLATLDWNVKWMKMWSIWMNTKNIWNQVQVCHQMTTTMLLPSLKTDVEVLTTDFTVFGKRYDSVIIVSFVDLFSESNKEKV